MGYKSVLKIRISHLGLHDKYLKDKWHANSQLLAPKKVFNKEVIAYKYGVIVEPENLFPAQPLPPEIIKFLNEKPTAVVVLSRVSNHWIDRIENI